MKGMMNTTPKYKWSQNPLMMSNITLTARQHVVMLFNVCQEDRHQVDRDLSRLLGSYIETPAYRRLQILKRIGRSLRAQWARVEVVQQWPRQQGRNTQARRNLTVVVAGVVVVV